MKFQTRGPEDMAKKTDDHSGNATKMMPILNDDFVVRQPSCCSARVQQMIR